MVRSIGFSIGDVNFSVCLDASRFLDHEMRTEIIKAMLANGKITEKVAEIIYSKLKNDTPGNENTAFLESLKKKLLAFHSFDKEKQEIDELNDKDLTFLEKSIQFSISGKVLTSKEEETQISELLCNNNVSVMIEMDFSKVFDESNEEKESRTEENESVFEEDNQHQHQHDIFFFL